MCVEDKFLRYVAVDTQSDPDSVSAPSTLKQLVLADMLKDELEALGLQDVHRSDAGIVYATLPANSDKDFDSIGLIAHMDTAQEMPDKDVRPRIIENWDGSTIQLNEQYSMSPDDFPELRGAIGDSIIVTDGTTLLGADDKAGIAIIMQLVDELVHSDTEHGKIMVAFTPDEEIGRGVENFDLDLFPVDYAYTVDGGPVASVDYETFNAAQADILIHGKAIHPGSAKDKMVNAANIACRYQSLMPGWMVPEHTSGREGFIHLVRMSADCENAHLIYILRDHDKEKFQAKKEIMKAAGELINSEYGDVCEVKITDSYENMKEYMHGDLRSVNKAYKALESLGITPRSTAVRGGTDGAMLTQRGLNTPNLGTGGGNCHGRYEFASIDKMKKMVEVLHHIVEDKD